MAADTVIEVMMKFVDNVSSGVDNVTKKIDGMASKTGNAAKSFAPVSAAAAGVLGIAAKMAVEFDTAGNAIKRTADLSTAELDKIKQSALQVAPALGVLPDKYLEIASSMAALGTKKSDIEAMTKNVIELGKATDQGAEKWVGMGQSVSAIQSIFQMSVGDVQSFTAAVNYADDKIGGTSEQILDFTKRVGSMASTLKMSASDTAVFAATFSKLGLSSDRSATAFNSLLGSLANIKGGSTASQESFAALGISADDMAKRINENPTKAIQFFLEKLNSSKLPLNEVVGHMQKAFGKEAADEIMTLAKGADTLKMGFDAVGDSAARIAEMQKANASALATISGQTELFKATTAALAIQLGSALLPALNSVLAGVVPVATAFNSLMSANPIIAQIIVGVLGLVAVIAPILGILSGVITAVGTISGAVGALLPVIGSISAVVGTLFATLAASPALVAAAIIAAVALVVAAIVMNWDKIKEVCTAGIEFVKQIISTGLDTLKAVVSAVVDGVKSLVTGFLDIIKTAITMFLDFLKTVIQAGMDIIKNIIKTVIDIIIGTFKTLVVEASKAGADMMREMANGINQNSHLVAQATAQATKNANQYLPHSPAKKGALKNLDTSGYALMDTIARGIKGYDMSSVMNGATGSIGGNTSPANSTTGSGTSTGITINYSPVINGNGSGSLMDELKRNQREIVKLIDQAYINVNRRSY